MIWSDLAQLDLDEIFRYYESFSLKVAITYLEEIIKAGDLLEFFPEMGPKEAVLSHLDRNYRSVLVLHRYKLIYLFEDNVCSILMVWDCRESPELLKNSDRFKDPDVPRQAAKSTGP